MRNYAMVRLAGKRVNEINSVDVMGVLIPIWSTKRSTAKGVRQRISAVMKWAVAQGYPPGQSRRRGLVGGAAEKQGSPTALPGAAARRGGRSARPGA